MCVSDGQLILAAMRSCRRLFLPGSRLPHRTAPRPLRKTYSRCPWCKELLQSVHYLTTGSRRPSYGRSETSELAIRWRSVGPSCSILHQPTAAVAPHGIRTAGRLGEHTAEQHCAIHNAVSRWMTEGLRRGITDTGTAENNKPIEIHCHHTSITRYDAVLRNGNPRNVKQTD